MDFSPLEALFREEFFTRLLQREAITPERIELLKSWRHSGFAVNSERRIPKGERKELESVLEYMERPPVSLSRLEYLPDGRVLYKGHYNPSLGRDHQLVSGLEFLAMLVPHVALRFECRIHCFGAISTTIRKALGWIQKDDTSSQESSQAPREVVVAEGDQSEFVRLKKKSWARLIAKVYLEDPTLCPGCGKEMKIISAITSPHQDDVIEKILKAKGQWDPPWKRVRKARGPPTPLETAPVEAPLDSRQNDEEYFNFNQVPPESWET